MKQEKVLILAYYFFPCNLPGAHRTFSWAKYFTEASLYPVVITRNWDHPIKKNSDQFVPAGDKILNKKKEGYEVYYLPYKGSLRDRFYNRYGENKMVFARRVLTYLELVAQNFTSFFLPYRSFYTLGLKLIKEDPAIKIILTSAMPFGLFRISSKLHCKTGIPWIADYRDDWNTTSWVSNYTPNSQVTGRKSLPEKILSNFEQRSEKKWLASADSITTVSKYYVDKISRYVGRPGDVIYNGFDISKEIVNPISNKQFTISYIGNMYWKQPIEIFLKGAAKAMSVLNTTFNINFIGTGFDVLQKNRLAKYAASENIAVTITDWVSETEVHHIISESHLMLAIAYNEVKGVIPSKIFNYLAFHKPILLCPSDNSELEETLLQSGLGIIANDEIVCSEKLIHEYQQFITGATHLVPNLRFIESLSRKSQALQLASIIHKTIRK